MALRLCKMSMKECPIFNLVIYLIFCLNYKQATQAIFAQKGSLLRCILYDDWTTLCHFYYVYNKYFDLVDTVIFVLRKKQNQITFLHVYHHCAVIVFPTWAFHVVPGECSSFSKTVYIYHQTLIVIPFRWNGQFDCRSQLRRPRSYVQLLLPDDLQ